MRTYTIGEVAERSGFSASALRYYEGIGLVEPADRTEAGYRLYDDRTLARLAFVARAKQLGCSLEEITDLVGIWDRERCGPVQRHLHELVTGKIGGARDRIEALTAFTAQLQAAAGQLAGEAVDGPCGDDCACVAAAAPVDDAAIACTLDASAMPDRLAAWRAVLAGVGRRTTTADGALRIELDGSVSLDELVALVVAEQRCCAFFSFAVTVDGRGTALEVRAPGGASEVVAALFGEAER